METKLLSGNEAIAQAAYEAGVAVAAGYPGTPSTEILETLSRYRDELYCEWAPNEKVAMETAAGAALNGAGWALSQPGLVLAKAVRVCLECVGIG